MKQTYTVARLNGNEIVETCGHEHKTYEAAQKCKDKLMNWSKDKKTCSAHWYNSRILNSDQR